MIIIKIECGLGNQMFQYAFARTLQIKKNVNVRLDISTYFRINSKYREYGLDRFNISIPKATAFQLGQFLSLQEQGYRLQDYKGLTRQLIRVCRRIFNIQFYTLYRKYFNKIILATDENASIGNLINIIDPAKDYYISGFFQNNEYVDDILPILRSEFSLQPDYLTNTKLAHKLKHENSVSIHVRRGDYVYLPDLFPVMGIDYFTTAIDIIQKKINNPTFYIFSNDKEWVKKKFDLGEHIHLVDEKFSENVCDDLLLMSMCKHHIIANSTYSWWGAKLNTFENKIVIAPAHWYTDPTMNKQTGNFIAKDWIRI